MSREAVKITLGKIIADHERGKSPWARVKRVVRRWAGRLAGVFRAGR